MRRRGRTAPWASASSLPEYRCTTCGAGSSRGGGRGQSRRRREARVVAEQSDYRALRRQYREGGLHRGLVGSRFHVEVEEILPRRRPVGPALELREIEASLGERRERARERPRPVRQLEAKGGLRRDAGRRRRRLARHDQEPCLVARLV